MKSKTPKTIGSIRLTPDYWEKLRKMWKYAGSAWLEKAIEREYKKLFGDFK